MSKSKTARIKLAKADVKHGAVAVASKQRVAAAVNRTVEGLR
jgi:hypothetical protein